MTCYSPSTVVRQYLSAGATLTVADLVRQSQAAVAWVRPHKMNEAGGLLCGTHGVNGGREFVSVTAFLPAPKVDSATTA